MTLEDKEPSEMQLSLCSLVHPLLGVQPSFVVGIFQCNPPLKETKPLFVSG